MIEPEKSIENKIIRAIQISLLALFYVFSSGVITFVSYGVYRSWINNDGWIQATIIATLIITVFIILISVITMVFGVMIKEGQKQA